MPGWLADYLLSLIAWVLVALGLLPIIGAIVWEVWEGQIRPRRIPQSEIEMLAADLVARYGDQAEEMAFINEDHAWRYSDSFEQGKWRRVRCFLSDHAPS